MVLLGGKRVRLFRHQLHRSYSPFVFRGCDLPHKKEAVPENEKPENNFWRKYNWYFP